MKIALYGDSIGRGVTYDEARGRYVYLKDGFDKLLAERGQETLMSRSGSADTVLTQSDL